MRISKYSGTGNTFLIFDNRKNVYDCDDGKYFSKLAFEHQVDGILFVNKSEKYDFKMCYLNRDGGEVSMCGNGARAITDYVHFELGVNKKDASYQFETLAGVYSCKLDANYGWSLQMTELYDVGAIQIADLYPSKFSLYLNTGVPHCIFEEDNLEKMDLLKEGKRIREDERFAEGVNVNFFKRISDNKIELRTYERGVEAETLSCGTGATAAAIVISKFFDFNGALEVKMKGGLLTILLDEKKEEVYLCGKVEKIN